MRNYVPFLKLKQGEILAVGALNTQLQRELMPFFDIPRGKLEEPTHAIEARLAKSCKQLLGNCQEISSLYLDDYDVPEDLVFSGKACYEYALEKLKGKVVVPVVGTDRSPERIDLVLRQKSTGGLTSGAVAVRVQCLQIQAEVVTGRLSRLLEVLRRAFSEVHLVIDCRVVTDEIRRNIASRVASLSRLGQTFEKVIVAGSTVPASIRDLAAPSETKIVARLEVETFLGAQESLVAKDRVYFGDYGIISPDYSDTEFTGTVFRKVTAPKVLYSFAGFHYLQRGASLESAGNSQYRNIFRNIIGHHEGIFRGADYSWGDSFIVSKASGEGKDVTPASVVKPLTNAHVTFMLRDFSPDSIPQNF